MERSFLDEVAQDLYSRYGGRVGDLRVLLPSKRARLFLTDSLSQLTSEPIWEPEWILIGEQMSQISGIESGEKIRLITELYKVYKRHHPSESFDRFYHWGEVMLADFDMVDKYMLDADQLFRNIVDLKELETDVSYLTEPQMKIIVDFWRSVSSNSLSQQKINFLRVWESLLPIYKEYRAALMELKIGYSGMIFRRAAEMIQSGEHTVDNSQCYVVAGFNALSRCESIFFDALKNSTTTHFYWDWDDYYKDRKSQEAGLFLEDNRLRFPSVAEVSHDNFRRDKKIEVVACSSSSLQCKYVAEVLDSIVREGGVIDKNTAIVLTDESLLLPLLYALPKYVGKVNVTMGYPLRQSLAYSFLERLLELQHHARGEGSFYHLDVVGLLSHPYLEAGIEADRLHEIEYDIRLKRLISIPAEMLHGGNELLREIFTVHRGWRDRSNYLVRIMERVATLSHRGGEEAEQRVEFLGFLSENILSLNNSIEQCDIELSVSVYLTLLRRHLQQLRIPFEGEPLEGLQVMGILETRNLDFDNVILLSMNDDNFPGNKTIQSSFIPYSLRAGFDLPTPEHHDGVYAYYFYRLVQRTKKLWMLYCSRADERSTGEQSRYVTQLEMESPFKIERVDVGVDVNLFDSEAIEIAKVGRVAEQLRHFSEEHDVLYRDGSVVREITRLSPTALFQYVACPLRFYFKSLARIRTEDELTEEVDSPMFGNILHYSMQELYKNLVGEGSVAERLSKISDSDILRAVDSAIRLQYLGDSSSTESFTGSLMLVREVVVNYIKGGILRYDRDVASPVKILGAEIHVEHFVKLDESHTIRFKGICDRVDRMSDGGLRIVDYKSSEAHLDFGGVERLFTGAGKERQSNIFQTLLYSYMLRLKGGDSLKDRLSEPRKITPALYYVRSMNEAEYSPLLRDLSREDRDDLAVTSYEPLNEEFETHLLSMLRELFDESIPFRQCAKEDVAHTCLYCDFQPICRRGN